jgi:hypothetical protein
MNTHHRLDVTLTLLGPILTHGNEPAEPGIDAPMARDTLGNFILPYSLVKGKILDALRDLRPPEFVSSWLGQKSAEGGYDPDRGRLRFSDFTTPVPTFMSPQHDGIIERIEINPTTGSAAGRMLAMLEAPFGYGQEVVFKGRVEFVADAQEALLIEATLKQAFDWVAAYGAMRTVGFGRKKEVSIARGEVHKSAQQSPADAVSLPIRYALDRPLCIVGRKHSGNHFESLECISGAVLKGAVAKLVLEMNGSRATEIDANRPEKRFATLCRWFEVIRFSEAKPMKLGADGFRPVEPPLSIVVSPTGQKPYYDVALLPGAQLVCGSAPEFLPDWKYKDSLKVREAFGWPDLPRERRTRTAIDPDKWRAEDMQLFSYGLVLPKKIANGKSEEFIWEGAIGLEEVPPADHAELRKELDELLACGLPNIGKTRATAHVTWLTEPTPLKIETRANSAGYHIITLQTDCLMTDPQALQKDSLQNAYEEFWRELSGGSLKLIRYFARQSLHGGFVAKRANKSNYEPFLLTDRGSVFVLQATDADQAKLHLDDWRLKGLSRNLVEETDAIDGAASKNERSSSPRWIHERYHQPLWKTCPCLSHVGFGEVAIDLACHTENRPNER